MKNSTVFALFMAFMLVFAPISLVASSTRLVPDSKIFTIKQAMTTFDGLRISIHRVSRIDRSEQLPLKPHNGHFLEVEIQVKNIGKIDTSLNSIHQLRLLGDANYYSSLLAGHYEHGNLAAGVGMRITLLFDVGNDDSFYLTHGMNPALPEMAFFIDQKHIRTRIVP